MDEWQKLIHVLVEIWTEEDIKNGRWVPECEPQTRDLEVEDDKENDQDKAA